MPKSGTETYGLDRFWSGVDNRAKRGLEASAAGGDPSRQPPGLHRRGNPDSRRAFTAGVAQTPPGLSQSAESPRSRIDFYMEQLYMEQLTGCLARFERIQYVVADGYYAKTKVFDAVRSAGRHFITKLRTDANLRYLYTGEQREGPGRPKIYDGKVQFGTLSRFEYVDTLDDRPQIEVYAKRLNSPHFKRDLRVVVLVDTEADSYVVLASTDCKLAPMQIVRFYRLRFQIELIFRDAKQFAGLTHCQARSKEKLAFHLNMSLAAVNVARLCIGRSKKAVSMNSYLRQAYNRWLAGHLLSRLGLEARFGINHPQVQQVIRMGSMTC